MYSLIKCCGMLFRSECDILKHRHGGSRGDDKTLANCTFSYQFLCVFFANVSPFFPVFMWSIKTHENEFVIEKIRFFASKCSKVFIFEPICMRGVGWGVSMPRSRMTDSKSTRWEHYVSLCYSNCYPERKQPHFKEKPILQNFWNQKIKTSRAN